MPDVMDAPAVGLEAVPPEKQVVRVETCVKCKFAVAVAGDFRSKECRRWPPTAVHIPQMNRLGQLAGSATLTGFPRPSNDAWCGEWRPRSDGLS
jgi:hypothetical protein